MDTRKVFLAASCVTLNLTLAKVAAVLSLPVFFDSVGTVVAAALLPLRYCLSVGLLTALAAGIVVHPAFAAYAGTQLAIAAVCYAAVRNGWLDRWWKALLVGEVVGIVAAVVSAPVTAVVFGGVVLSGTTAINAILIASGHSLWKSVLGGSLVTETIDKPAATLIAWLVLERIPRDLHLRLRTSTRS